MTSAQPSLFSSRARGSEDDTCPRTTGLRPEGAPTRTSAHKRKAVEGSKAINIKTRGVLEKNHSAMYIMYQDRYGLSKIPYRQATEE